MPAEQTSPGAHCRVLPPGEFNDMILQQLPIYSESFEATAATVFHIVAVEANVVTS